jgi:phage tail-like protein
VSPQAQRSLVKVPEVTGLPLPKAKLLLENAGLGVDDITFQESYDPRNTVLMQKPSRGQMIYAGERVTLSVSRESYLRWMPALFHRNDALGRNIIRDILWIVQHLFGSIEERLNEMHKYFDPYETPEKFLPWLASWTAMIVEEDWPVAKKRRLIRKAVELYRIRGTVKGLKLFVSLFTGHEPEIRENAWPFRGWRVGITSAIGVDTVVLPPVNLARSFIVEMPMSYTDISTEAVIRIHEIIQLEKPSHTQYYLQFAVEDRSAELREFFAIGTRSGIGIGQEVVAPVVESEAEYETLVQAAQTTVTPAVSETAADDFTPASRKKRPILRAPRADTAPVEGQEVRSSVAGFGDSARQMEAAVDAPKPTEASSTPTVAMAASTIAMAATAAKPAVTIAPPAVTVATPAVTSIKPATLDRDIDKTTAQSAADTRSDEDSEDEKTNPKGDKPKGKKK